jgi:2-(1,2-epoxy-1,2-dihydrophenyl)acetyl-CoA isomerase
MRERSEREASMDESPVRVEARPGYRVVTLNRPDKLNSFNEAMHEALRAALEEAAADRDTGAVVLTGAGRAFCAGQDLSDRVMGEGGKRPDLGDTLERTYNPLVRRLHALPFPVVCAVNGVAAGAGANVALACDVVLAARSAKFLQAFAKIGLIPDSGGTWTLPHLVGRARAMALAMLAETVTAEEAESWGMIWKAVDDAALMGEAETLAERLAAMPTGALVAVRRAIDAAATNGLDAQLDLERDLQAELGRGDDYAEGVRAFLEKRPAKFGPRGGAA